MPYALNDLEDSSHDASTDAFLAQLGIETEAYGEHNLDISGVSGPYNAKVKLLNNALQDIGMGSFQWKLYVACGFGWFMDSFWMFAVSMISLPVQREFAVEKIASLILFKYLGLVLGSTAWPLLADSYGRLFTFNATIFMSSISGILASFLPNYAFVLFFMFCIGFATGGNQPVDAMLFVELIPPSHQYLILYESLFWGAGLFSAAIMGWPFIAFYTCPDELTCSRTSNMGWRYAYFTFGVVTLILALVRYYVRMYESPKYFLNKGQHKETVEVVRNIALRNNKKTWLSVETLDTIDSEYRTYEFDNDQLDPWPASNILSRCIQGMRRWKVLFLSKDIAYTTLLLWGIWGFSGLAFPLFNGFLPFYLQWKGIEVGKPSLNRTYANYAFQSAFSIPSGVVAGYLSETRLGRKGVGFLGGVLSGAFMYLFILSESSSAYLLFNCGVSFVTTFIYAAMYAYTAEVYPAPLRGVASASCSFFNRACGLIGPLISLHLDISNGKPVYISGGLFIIAGIMFLLLPHETRGKAAL